MPLRVGNSDEKTIQHRGHRGHRGSILNVQQTRHAGYANHSSDSRPLIFRCNPSRMWATLLDYILKPMFVRNCQMLVQFALSMYMSWYKSLFGQYNFNGLRRSLVLSALPRARPPMNTASTTAAAAVVPPKASPKALIQRIW